MTGLSLGPNVLTARAPGATRRARHGHQPPQRRPGLLGPAGPAVGLPVDRGRLAVQPAGELRVPLQVDRAARSPTTTPTARRPTSPTRRPTRARPSRTSSGSRPATRTATSTRSPCCTTRPSRGRRGIRRRQWNHKLLITHGASCGIERQAGSAPDVENDAALSRGFAVMSTALNNAGHNCNIVTQAESMVMAKERLVEQYGEIRYTIGTGCSGGSLTQQQVANAYPGHLPGHPARLQLPGRVVDGPAARRLPPRAPVRREPRQVGDRRGLGPGVDRRDRGSPQPRQLDRLRHASTGRRWAIPDDGCPGVPAEDTYNAADQPGGVRCTLADYMINVLGPRPSSVWIPAEQQVGPRLRRASARQRRRPVRARGAQEGPDHDRAVRRPERQDRRRRHRQRSDGRALPGGPARPRERLPQRRRQQHQQPRRGRDHRPARPGPGRVPRRLPLVGDPRPARARARDVRQPRDLVRGGAADGRPELRDRGNARDGPVARGGRGATTAPARWRRRSSATVRATSRIAARRSPGLELVSLPGVGTICELKDVQTRYGTPRTVAGEGVETDTNKCALKPLRRLDYYPIAFTDAQWQRLQGAFPTGVCDWSWPGSTRPTRSRGRRTRTGAATSSTAAGPSARHRPARAAAGRATRSAPGAGKGPPFAQRFSASSASSPL